MSSYTGEGQGGGKGIYETVLWHFSLTISGTNMCGIYIYVREMSNKTVS